MSKMSPKEYVELFKEHFIGGYKSVLPISDFCLKTIPDFQRLRQFIYYAVLYQEFGTENLTENQLQDLAEFKNGILDSSWADIGFV